MALPQISFNISEGGLGRPLATQDHISGMLFYTAGALPPGFAVADRIKKILSVGQAEDLGIVADHSDETLGAGGKVVISGIWLAGETATISIDGGILATFIVLVGATAISDVVAGLVAAINAGTGTGIKHGWTAADVGGTDVVLTQPAKLGIVNNAGAHIVFTETSAGTGAGVVTQFAGGVGSYFALLHYHISEYFREQPKGVLFVGIFAQAAFDAAEVETIQNFTNGDIRNLGIYLSHEVFATSQLNLTQGKVDTLDTEDKPLSVLFHSDLSGATLATLPNLATLSDKKVSMLIGEEGDFHQAAYDNAKAYLSGEKVTFQGKAYISKATTTGNAPWDGTKWTELRENLQAISGFSIGTMGVQLGAVSLSLVHESIGWLGKFNLVSGTGLDEAAFATTDLFKDISVALRNTLNDFHYIFLKKEIGISGTFSSDSHTAISETSDFSTIENNRTIDKAKRGIRSFVLPNLSRPIFVNEDGTLTEDIIALFKNDSEKALIDMITAGELSAQAVNIDPSQNVLATSKVTIGIVLVPVGVAREIEFNIGFEVSI